MLSSLWLNKVFGNKCWGRLLCWFELSGRFVYWIDFSRGNTLRLWKSPSLVSCWSGFLYLRKLSLSWYSSFTRPYRYPEFWRWFRYVFVGPHRWHRVLNLRKIVTSIFLPYRSHSKSINKAFFQRNRTRFRSHTWYCWRSDVQWDKATHPTHSLGWSASGLWGQVAQTKL